MSEQVHCRRTGRVALLTLDNGPLNVCSRAMITELDGWLERLREDQTVGALILTGAGDRAFAAGADISGFPELAARGAEGVRAYLMEDHRVFRKLDAFPKPTIAAINGLALGGGLELTLMCDFRVAEEQAQFGFPEIRLGMFPGYGGTQRMARLIGAEKTKELIFTGRRIPAAEALALGIVGRLVPRGAGVETALAAAEAMAAQSAPVLALAKRAVDEGLELPLEEGIALEARLLAQAFQTRDHGEGVRAFQEKRTPVFEHR